ncbi:glycoside hydrolase, superfamily [Purpureocillium lavendulum]|uniref:Glycoside hydrolase, superfamily n=1 Tax=Purpureocillium lavendulum TaxID=1247861 RepID=A0AB34FLK7_9HYPO|nr:glycoside hydrolase, superfamily [Purpureocillium lavendulum]
MALGRFLLSAVVLGRLAVCHPAGTTLARRDDADADDIIIYDSSVTEPTRVPQVLLWVDSAGKPVETATEDVLLLPTSLALGQKSQGSAIKASVTAALSTQTLLLPTQAQGSSAHAIETTVAARPPPTPAPETQQLPAPEPEDDNRASSHDSPTSPKATSAHSQATAAAVPDVPSPDGLQDRPQSQEPSANSGPPTSELYGVSYAPYRGSGGCKSMGDIQQDFDHMAKEYSLVRIYGTGCDQVANVYSAAKSHGMKVFLGIWDPRHVDDEVNTIISAIKGDWDVVHTVSVGNELVNNGQASPDDIEEAVKSARSTLRAAGYKGPVVTVDTFTAVAKYPQLCAMSDYCAINAHAFFDQTIEASEAGQWLRRTVGNIRAELPGPKNIVVTETGWPMKGRANGMAVPGLANQKLALTSIKDEFAATPGDVILFSAFNDLWKQDNPSTFNADKYWGIGGAVSSCDQ